jgi:ubiquinone/menaquinone biosynthesis C-methylase UbiE
MVKKKLSRQEEVKTMAECLLSSKITEVYSNVDAHRRTAEFILRHSTNRYDIREAALRGVDLSNCRNILDLGCGFGFFTRSLGGKVHPDAVVTGMDTIGSYEPLFREACAEAGVKGKFIPSDASAIANVSDKTLDLIVCSYALYFFPEIIPHISRVLKEDGFFITITHGEKNMRELIDFAGGILVKNTQLEGGKLPIESIIRHFSSHNCRPLLSSCFGRVIIKNYINSLVFQPENVEHLFEYFRFKSPFFVTDTDVETEEVIQLLSCYLQKISLSGKIFIMNKDDIICICSAPLQRKNNEKEK